MREEDRTLLRERGWLRVADANAPLRMAIEDNPRGAAEIFFPREVEWVEFQQIKGTGRGGGHAVPLHTDPHRWNGRPPNARVVFCLLPAEQGGETHVLDAWELAHLLSDYDQSLLTALFEEQRDFPYASGVVRATSLAVESGHLFFTQAPETDDRIARELALHVQYLKPVSVPLDAGQAIVLDNHRMLHGRAAYTSPQVSLYRLLVWTRTPVCPPPADLMSRVVKDDGGPRPGGPRGAMSEKERTTTAKERLTAVLALLRGAKPDVIAKRYRVTEATLEIWRETALHAMEDALK